MAYKHSQKEIDFKLGEIQGCLSRSEYEKVLNSAVVFLLTQKEKLYEEKIMTMLRNELELLTSEKSEKFVYQQRMIGFVQMAENLMRVMDFGGDEKFIEELLSLTDSNPSKSSRMKRFSLFNSVNNQKHIVNRDTGYMKNILTLSDVLLSSSNHEIVRREKMRFVNKIHQFVMSLCNDPNLNSHLIRERFLKLNQIFFY